MARFSLRKPSNKGQQQTTQMDFDFLEPGSRSGGIFSANDFRGDGSIYMARGGAHMENGSILSVTPRATPPTNYSCASKLYTTNHSSSLGHHQPVLLMTPPLLSKKNSTNTTAEGEQSPSYTTANGSGAGGDETTKMFQDFDGVHVDESEDASSHPRSSYDSEMHSSVRDVSSAAYHHDNITPPSPPAAKPSPRATPTGFTFDQETPTKNSMVAAQDEEGEDLSFTKGDEDENSSTEPNALKETSEKNSSEEEIVHVEATLYHPKPQRLVNKEAFEEAQVLSSMEAKTNKVAELSSPQDNKDDDANDNDEEGERSAESSVASPEELKEFNLSSALDDLQLNQDNPPQPPDFLPADHQVSRQSERTHTRDLSHGSASSLDNVLNPRPSRLQEVPPPPPPAENGDPMVYYPAPIPVQLRLPPLLSKKSRQGAKPRVPSQESAASSDRVVHSHVPHINPNRASTILPPPDWTITEMAPEKLPDSDKEDGEDDYYQHSSRPASPASTIDSGRATIESDDEDERNLDEVVLKQPDAKQQKSRSPSPSKKSATSSKRKSFLNFNKLIRRNKDEQDDEPDPEEAVWASIGQEDQYDPAKEMSRKNMDHLAFTHYNPGKIQATTDNFALGSNGIIPGDDNKPSSLIEELELRKAGRKARSHLYHYDGQSNGYGNASPDDTESAKRLSVPVLQDKRRSLLQLEKMARTGYDSQLASNNYARLSQGHLGEKQKSSGASIMSADQDETLGARRTKLKLLQQQRGDQMSERMSMSSNATGQEESLSQARARIKRQRQSMISTTDNNADNNNSQQSEETLAQRRARLRQQKPPSLTRIEV
jgi:hypothetical protein